MYLYFLKKKNLGHTLQILPVCASIIFSDFFSMAYEIWKLYYFIVCKH